MLGVKPHLDRLTDQPTVNGVDPALEDPTDTRRRLQASSRCCGSRPRTESSSAKRARPASGTFRLSQVNGTG